MRKSEIVPVGEVGNIDALAAILRCRVGSLPMKYLGMPLGTSFKTTFIWNPIFGEDREEVVWLEAFIFV